MDWHWQIYVADLQSCKILILILRSFEGTVYRYDNTGSQLFQVEINSAWLAKIPIADDDHTFGYDMNNASL